MAYAQVTSTTFAAGGAQSCSLPPGRVGDYMTLYVVADQGGAMSAPAGWALEASIRTVAPRGFTFSRVRQAGDTSVAFTTTAEGTAMVVDYPRPLAALTEVGGGLPPTNPFTIGHLATDPGDTITLVHWTTATAYTDTAGDFARVAIEPRAGLTLSVYEATRTPGDDLSGTFEDTVGIYRASLGFSYDHRAPRWWAGVGGWV